MRLFARLSACLMLCLSPALLGHCGGATDGGLMGTETGNPPVVDSHKLRLVAGATGVELIAQPGAVAAGAQIRLDNRSSGVSAVVTANSDGSFRVEVTGGALDTFEVTVTHQGGTITLQLTVTTSSEPPPGGELTALSCDQLDTGLTVLVRSAIEPFAAGCTSDADCSSSSLQVGCHRPCGNSYVLAGQEAAAEAAAAQSVAGSCAEIEQRACPRVPSAECPADLTPAMCHEGTCQAMDFDRLSCGDLASRAAQLVAVTFANVDRSCNVDADCTTAVVPPASCAYACYFSGPLAASAVEGLRQSIATIEDDVCGAYTLRACAPGEQRPCAGPEVIAPENIVCVENRCTIQEEP